MMLYRPFLHYISPRLSAGRVVDERYYACAAAGISVSRNIIHIAMEIKNQALVVGPFWSMLYTEFFAILTLVFYVLENPEKQGSAEIFADAAAGREMIIKMAPRSLAADRINGSLNTLWKNLPESIKNGKARAPPSRKRSAPGPKPGLLPLSANKAPSSAPKLTSAASRRSMKQRPSFDSAHRTPPQRALATNYPELLPMDVSSIGASTPPTAHPSSHYIRTSQTLETPNLYKMMFSRDDPFAYPNQPLLDYGGNVATHSESPSSHISATLSHPTDSSNFYMSGLYGDIDGQLSKSLGDRRGGRS